MRHQKERYKKLLRFSLIVLLILVETLFFACIWKYFYNENIPVPFVKKGNFFFCVVYAIFLLIFLNSFDGLKYGIYRKTNLVTAQILATFSTAFMIYLQIVLMSLEFVSPTPLILMGLGDGLIIFFITLLGEILFRKIFPPKKTLIIYDSYEPGPFIQKAKSRKDKFDIRDVIHISIGLENLEKILSEYESVIIYDVHSEIRNKILKFCFEYNIRAYTTTKVSDILIRGSERLHIFDTPLLLYRNIGLTPWQKLIKRSFDIVFSLFALILTSPLFLFVALAIKLEDGGPVFFRQERSTLNGKTFRIHKFRSMIVNAEKEGEVHPAEAEDTRITKVGKMLRFARLDELPQLIDILMGDMSVVGPRPERVEHVKLYTENIPEFSYRLKVRGGLTGYAQLYGKYNTSPYDKLQLDLMYIQNYSFLLDIKLILMTLKIMFMKESTEGFTEEKSKDIQDKT